MRRRGDERQERPEQVEGLRTMQWECNGWWTGYAAPNAGSGMISLGCGGWAVQSRGRRWCYSIGLASRLHNIIARELKAEWAVVEGGGDVTRNEVGGTRGRCCAASCAQRQERATSQSPSMSKAGDSRQSCVQCSAVQCHSVWCACGEGRFSFVLR